jgi:hypothetical protein
LIQILLRLLNCLKLSEVKINVGPFWVASLCIDKLDFIDWAVIQILDAEPSLWICFAVADFEAIGAISLQVDGSLGLKEIFAASEATKSDASWSTIQV